MTETSTHTNHVEHRTMLVIDTKGEAIITTTRLLGCEAKKAIAIKTNSMCLLANLERQIMSSHGCSGHKQLAPVPQNRLQRTDLKRSRRECTWSSRLVKRKREHGQSRLSQRTQEKPIAQLLFALKRDLDTKRDLTNTNTSQR